LSFGRVGHGASDINVSRCTSHSNITLVIVDNDDIVIITSTISAIPVSTTMVTVSVMSIAIVRSLVEWGKLLLLHLASRDDPDFVPRVARLDVNRSTVSMVAAILIDDSIGIFSVIPNNIDLGRVSLVVTINNHSITVSASLDNSIAMSTSLDDRGIVSVTSSLDNGGLVMMTSSSKEGLDLFHDRLSLVDSDQRSVSVMAVTIDYNDLLIVVVIV
jgi:hypothetical protein